MAEALAVCDELGFDAIRIHTVAERLSVRDPSLYTHVDGLDDLLDAVAVQCTTEFADCLRAGVGQRQGTDAFRGFARAWRDYVRRGPARYRATLREVSPEARAAQKAAAAEATDACRRALAAMGVDETSLPAATRSVRAALHGFSTLERGGSMRRADETFTFLLGLVERGLSVDESVDSR